MTAGEAAFLDQMTRKKLVTWGDVLLTGGTLVGEGEQVYLDHARSRGWISKKSLTLTSKGWKTAASFLKR